MDVENGKDIVTQETIRDDLKKIVETEKQIVAIESKMDEIKKQQSYCSLEIIKNTINDQDFQQKMGFIPLVAVELYRVLVSSLLILFVPQKCVDHVCSLSENMVWENHLYNAGLVVNFITLFTFLSLYYCEVKRENRLITYLDVNKNVPSDNDSVGKVLELLPLEKRNHLLYLDKWYQRAAYSSILLFMFNTILSGFVVFDYYLDNQTTSTYITNILFMVTKLGDIYATANTEKNVFYSAYLKGKIQYNDVDPDKKVGLTIEDLKEEDKKEEKEDKKEDNKEDKKEEISSINNTV
jgi:hypothetical protein